MIHQKKNWGHRTSKIVKSRQSSSDGHLPYHLFILWLGARAHAWRGMWIFVHSKDAQKQLARTSLNNRRPQPDVDDGNRKRDISFETSLRMYNTLRPVALESRTWERGVSRRDENVIPWSQRFFLIFHRMRELRESRKTVNTSREAVRKTHLWSLWTWISLSCRRQLSNASIWQFKKGLIEA